MPAPDLSAASARLHAANLALRSDPRDATRAEHAAALAEHEEALSAALGMPQSPPPAPTEPARPWPARPWRERYDEAAAAYLVAPSYTAEQDRAWKARQAVLDEGVAEHARWAMGRCCYDSMPIVLTRRCPMSTACSEGPNHDQRVPGLVGSCVRIGERTEVYAVHEGVLVLRLVQVSLLTWQLVRTDVIATPERLAAWVESTPSDMELRLVAEAWRRVRVLRSEVVLEPGDYVAVLDGEPS